MIFVYLAYHEMIIVSLSFQEPLIGRSDTICGGRTRESWVFTTKSPQLEIRLVTGSPGKSKYFLLKYEGKFLYFTLYV